MTDNVPAGSASEAPLLFPPRSTTQWSFASVGKIGFGWFEWNRKAGTEFQIYKYGGLSGARKILHHYPLTLEGWLATWRVLSVDYPLLAKEVAEAVDAPTLYREKDLAIEAARKELEEQGVVSFVPNCVLLGGFGYGTAVTPGTSLDLRFTRKGTWITLVDSVVPSIPFVPYSELASLAFSGPGAVKKGGVSWEAGSGFRQRRKA